MSADSKSTEMKEVANHSKKSVRTCDTACGRWRNNEEKVVCICFENNKGIDIVGNCVTAKGRILSFFPINLMMALVQKLNLKRKCYCKKKICKGQ